MGESGLPVLILILFLMQIPTLPAKISFVGAANLENLGINFDAIV